MSGRLLSCPDDAVRHVATELVSSRHHLSKIHTKYSKIPTELEKLPELLPLAVYNLKCALVECDLRRVNEEISSCYDGSAGSLDRVRELMMKASELNNIKKELAKYLGERILTPRARK